MIAGQITQPVRIWLYVAVLLVGLVLGAAASWNIQKWRLGAKVAEAVSTDARKDALAQSAARAEEQIDRKKEQNHAQDSNANETQLVADLKKLARAEARRADDARRRTAELVRLHSSSEQRAATTRAWAKAESTARSDLADRLIVVEGQLERGIGVVDRGVTVVERLQGTTEQRDAEVDALKRQINIERRLSTKDVEKDSSDG